MINDHDSWAHRLPPEMLVTVASHLEDDTSLVTATHVCHLWRTTLLSSSRLWSNLDFISEECALAFLGRSKSTPLVVDLMDVYTPSEIVRESLNDIATRATTIRAEHSPFLDELLARPMPMLEVLEITESDELPPKKPAHLPSLTSLTIYGFDLLLFHAPLLTSFHLAHDSINASQELTAGTLLNFLRNCPLLETVFFDCIVLPDFDEVVSLPLLRSFTHESPCDEYQLYLFDRLSLPSTCQVVLKIDVTEHGPSPWVPSLPTPRNASYFSDIRTIKITADSCHPPDVDDNHVTFRTELVNSKHKAISFERISYYSRHPSTFSYRGFLGIPESVGIDSIETLCFDGYPIHTGLELRGIIPAPMAQELWKFQNLKTLVLARCSIALFLDKASSCPTIDTLVHRAYDFYVDLLQMQEFAESRKKAGHPLKTVTLVYPFAKPCPSQLKELRNCVGLVKVVSGNDASGWDTDEYLLDTATHEDNPNRS